MPEGAQIVTSEEDKSVKDRLGKGLKLAREDYRDSRDALNDHYRLTGAGDIPINLEAALGFCLENTKMGVIGELSKKGISRTEALTQSDIGSFIDHAFPLITAILPSTILNNIVSVQPMDREVGKVFYLNYIYETAKGDISSGDTIADAKSGLGAQHKNLSSWYTTEEIRNESVGAAGAAQYSDELDFVPAQPNSVVFQEVDSSGAVIQEVTDDGDGNLIGDVDSGGVNEVDYTNGGYDFTFASTTGDNVVVDYKTDLDKNPANTPRVKFLIENETLEAEKRQLAVNWLLDSGFELMQHYGEAIEDLLETQMASLVRAEIDRMFTTDLLNVATTADAGTFDASTLDYRLQNPRNEDFVNFAIANQDQIEAQTGGRLTGTWMMGGSSFVQLMKGLADFESANPSQSQIAGPHLIGTWKDFDIYSARHFPANDYIMGAKGDNFLDAAAVWAPFQPLMITEGYFVDNMVREKGLMTRNARKIINPGAFVRGQVLNTTR